MPLLVVRHAHAGRRSAYKGDDRLRPLSPRGRHWAVALIPLLSAYRPERILSSPYVRCVQTVAPTAEALGLAVEPVEALAEGHGAEEVPLLAGLARQSAVVCSHGDVATAILDFLVPEAEADAASASALRLQKGDVWVIEPDGDSLVIVDHIRRTPRHRRSSEER